MSYEVARAKNSLGQVIDGDVKPTPMGVCRHCQKPLTVEFLSNHGGMCQEHYEIYVRQGYVVRIGERRYA